MKAVIAVAFAALSLAACQPKPTAAPVESTPSTSASALSPDEQGLTTPQAFLEAIYLHYRDSDQDIHFTTLNDSAPDYYDPDMTALMQEDGRLSEGDIGAIDADPICNCQDYGKITATVTIKSQTETTAKASVLLDNKIGNQHGKWIMTYDLVRVGGKWRIHDIGTQDQPSLRDVFIRSNKELAADAASSAVS